MSDKQKEKRIREEKHFVKRMWAFTRRIDKLIKKERDLYSLYEIVRKRVLEVTKPYPDSIERERTPQLPYEERIREVDGIGKVYITVDRKEEEVVVKFSRLTVERVGAFTPDKNHFEDLVTIRLFWGELLNRIQGKAILEDFGDKDLIDTQKRKELFQLLNIEFEDEDKEGETEYKLV